MLFNIADSDIEYPQNQENLAAHFIVRKNYFLEVFDKIFETEYNYKIGFKQQIKIEILLNFVTTLQAISIIWYPNLEVSDWNSYKDLWKMLGIVNYAKAGALFGLLDLWIYGAIFIHGIFCTFFSIFLIFYYLEKKPPSFLVLLLRKLAKSISTFCLIPLIQIFLIVSKYSIFNFSSVDELDNANVKNIDFGVIGIIFSVFFLLITILIAFLYEVFSCDLCHINIKKNVKAKSCATLDVQRQVLFVFMCISYVIFEKKYAVYHQIICFALAFLLEIKTIWTFQYFNSVENAIQACKMGSISLSLLIFIFGWLLDNSLIILVFTLILQPLVLLFLIHYTSKSYANCKNDENLPKNQFEFERKFRSLLINPNPDDKYWILKAFDRQWKMIHFKKDKLFVIWEFNYCISILNDEKLARVKLTKLSLCKDSIEGNLQEWKAFNWLKTSQGSEFPEIIYLEFLQKFGKLKERDEGLCYLIIQLQAGFASRNPRIYWLEKLSTKTAKIMNEVNEGYKRDTEKYKNTETLELYASYLENILKKHREASLITKKKNGIDYSYRKDNYLEKYGTHVGILLISCKENTFGDIIYLNDKAAEILKLPVAEIYGNTIFNFIPRYYRTRHESLMKNFICDSESVEIPYHHNLFFQNQFGFLMEWDVLIKLTAYYDNCYYLISFQQNQKSRQFALISEENVIIEHSEFFSNILGYDSKYIKNRNISEIFPFIDMSNLNENEPWIEKIKNREICVVYVKKLINEEILNVLYVIDNVSEQKMKHDSERNKGFSVVFEQIEDISQINENTPKNIEETEKSKISFRNIEESTPLTCENDFTQQSQLFSDKNIFKSSSTIWSNIYLEQLQNLIFQSKKKIIILKWVLFTVTLAAIITMISLMANIVNDVHLTSSMVIFRNLGDLLYNIGLSADIARTICKSIVYHLDYSSQNAPFLAVMNDLQIIQNSILNDFDKWKFCPASNVATHSLIPLWTFDEKLPKIINKNLYNALGEFILHVIDIQIKNMIDALANNQTDNYIAHAKFLIMNGIGQTYDYLNHTILNLENCAINQIETVGGIIFILIFWGFAGLGILLVIIFIFVYLTAKKIDEFWNSFIKHSQIPLMKLKGEAIERLMYAHNTEVNIEDSTNLSRGKENSKVRTWIEINFTWKFLILFIISASYYFAVYFYLYPDCESYMINRPKLINNFNIRRSLVSRVCMLSRDVYTPWFNKNFLLSYGFANSDYLMNFDANILRKKNKELREEKFVRMMSKELRQRVFESTNLTAPILKLGSEAAVEISIEDSLNIAYTFYTPPGLVLQYVAYLQIVQNNIGIEFQLADSDSYDAISYQLNIIIATTVVYSVIICGLFFIYYLPFLHSQIKRLNLLSYLLEILSID